MVLSTKDGEVFYRLFRSVLAYTSRQLNVVGGATTIEAVRKLPVEEVAKLRDALYDKSELLDRYVDENPDQFKDEDLVIISSWNHRISGDFYVVRHLKAYTVFMGEKPSRLYGVFGLQDPVEEVLAGAPLPILVKAVLFPFRDRIIYDGLMAIYRVSFGGGIRAEMNATYSRLKETEGIIDGLAGPDGSAQLRSSLARKAPPKPAPNWGPAIDQIVAQTEKMRDTDTRLQGAAFGLLRTAASLARATLLKTGAEAEAARRLRALRGHITTVEKLFLES